MQKRRYVRLVSWFVSSSLKRNADTFDEALGASPGKRLLKALAERDDPVPFFGRRPTSGQCAGV
ncbi:hypothetical protein F01_460298 [Burkholderia cenocepacia]|nr:hypothetical protein F01_460298 [Burkholderia cenocepacia]